MDDRQLELSIEISFLKDVDLSYFDQGVLAAVLGKSDMIRREDPAAEISFCGLDSDLWPWDRRGRRDALRDVYDRHEVWVFGGYDLTWPERPGGWPNAPAE